jgi:hypothetical protein
MNPLCRLKANAFYFGEPGEAPRAVIMGPWLYVHAPDAELPPGVEAVSDAFRRRKHLGALHARLRVTDSRSAAVLPRLISALKRAGKASRG